MSITSLVIDIQLHVGKFQGQIVQKDQWPLETVALPCQKTPRVFVDGLLVNPCNAITPAIQASSIFHTFLYPCRTPRAIDQRHCWSAISRWFDQSMKNQRYLGMCAVALEALKLKTTMQFSCASQD